VISQRVSIPGPAVNRYRQPADQQDLPVGSWPSSELMPPSRQRWTGWAGGSGDCAPAGARSRPEYKILPVRQRPAPPAHPRRFVL